MLRAEDLTVSVEEQCCDGDLGMLEACLESASAASGFPRDARRLGVFLRTPEGRMAGGLFGVTLWNWLFIKHLWVHEALRGKGAGSRLVSAAENEARRRGCAHAAVDTFSFQAPGFYQRLGYRVAGRLEDCPPGETRYYLEKRVLSDGEAGK